MEEDTDKSLQLIEDVDDLFLSPLKNNLKQKDPPANHSVGDDRNGPSTSGITNIRSQRKRDFVCSPPTCHSKKIRLETKGSRVGSPVEQFVNTAFNLDSSVARKSWSLEEDEEDIQILNRLSHLRPLDSWREIDHTDSEAEDADASGPSTADGVRTHSDSEVDRDRKAPIKRQRSSRTIVLSDSESETPSPRIKKSPRCQIFPRQALNSSVPRTSGYPRARHRVPVLVGGMKLDVDVREESVERLQGTSGVRRSSSISPIVNFPDDSMDIEIDSDIEFMDPVRQVQQMEEDENLARRLQAEYDAEMVSPRPIPRANRGPSHSIPPNQGHQRQLRPRLPSAHGERRIAATFRVNNQLNGMDHNVVTTLPLRIELRPTPQGTRVAFQRPQRGAHGGRWDAWNLLFTDIDNDYEGLLDLADLMGEVRKGLTEAEIGQLPTRTVTRDHILKRTPSGTRTRCHICMCDYEVGEEMRSLTCFHEFHSACIDRWLKENATCPICRGEVKLTNE